MQMSLIDNIPYVQYYLSIQQFIYYSYMYITMSIYFVIECLEIFYLKHS